MRTTGVALVTYNRPEHTARVLETLKQVRPLYIFSDGPEDAPGVKETREIIANLSWGNPRLIKHDENLGLARSIVGAVDYVLRRHETVILLEDDCLPGPYLFSFMYACLARYEEDERVFGITGYTVPIDRNILDDYDYDAYFSPRIGSWGWATWRSKWKHYRRDLAKAYQEAIDQKIDLNQGGKDVPSITEAVLSGNLDAWTMGWVLATYLNHGMYVYPTVSHIENIGMDGTGIHTGKTDKWNTPIATRPSLRLPNDLVLDQRILRHYESFFSSQNTTLSLSGEREIERRFVDERLPVGKGNVLDLGPDVLGGLSLLAMERGYDLMAIGLEDTRAPIGHFIKSDFLETEITDLFDTILVISTIEHFGLAGRYGVEDDDPDADLKGMAKLRSLLKPSGRLLLTVPVGQDATISPWHRVYGRKRLPRLLDGYTILEEKYWAKNRHDNYLAVDNETALNTYPCAGPHFYYALGQFTLMVDRPAPKDFSVTGYPTATEAKLYYCSFCDRRYLPKLLALHASMEEHCQPYNLWVLALDEMVEHILETLNLPNVTFVGMSDFVDHAILQAKDSDRRYDEFVWTLTPSWILFVLRNAPGIGAVIYLDADSCMYSSPKPVLEEIGNASVAIVPHRFAPEHSKNLIYGIFNVNGVYARNDPIGLACMRQWRRQCNAWCYRRFDEDRFCDQKYLEAWPFRFGAHIIEHPGWNLAPWNQNQYHYSPGGREIHVEGIPIIMYHFHGLIISDEATGTFIISPYPLALPVEHIIYGIYTERLSEAIGEIANIPGTQLIVPEVRQTLARPQIAEIPMTDDFTSWIRAIGDRQTDGLRVKHLEHLSDLIKEHQPDTIVDIVSGCGLTLRLWLLADDIEVVAIGDQMGEIYESWRSLPLEMGRVRWTNRAIEDVDFTAMWDMDKKVLFYFTLHNRKIGHYLLKNAISHLPKGSIAAINDIRHGLVGSLNIQHEVTKTNDLITFEV